MKKALLYGSFILAFSAGCKKTGMNDSEIPEPSARISKRTCASDEILQAQLRSDPGLKNRMDAIEDFTREFVSSSNVLVNGVIHIPVVVNVLYRTSTENISIDQIQSQIDVLNEDFNNTNTDKNKVPSVFDGAVGNVGVRFDLYTVNRKSTTKKSWGANDAMKKVSQGGIDPTDPQHKLNMWCCNLGQSLLGYAQFPGGNYNTDGVVILYKAFGSKKKYPGGTYDADYDLGRTATHEVGHWMNLYHIWGDDGKGCNGSDRVTDTPNQGSENYGCPTFPHLTCSNGPNGDMFMNYMDYTDDKCMFMFTNGQAQRMLAVFAPGGARSAIGQ